MNIVKEFEHILKTGNITTLFQPIVSLNDGHVIGYESLSRGPNESPLNSPLELLKIAQEQNKLWELELLFRTKAIEKSTNIEKGKLLFLNVDPHIIKDPNFKKGFTKDFLSKHNISPKSIIFEITERTAIEDYKSFKKILNNYVEQGYKIAIDDAGSGYSGLKTITETKPHYIKIDMDLIRDIHKDMFKQAIIKAFISLSSTTNIKLIAEGIECKQELKTLIKLGVHAGQGYYLQRPAGTFLDIPESKKSYIKKYNKLFREVFDYSNNYHYIGNIMDETKTFKPSATSEEIKKFFDNTNSEGACITKNDYPVGLVMKHSIDSILAKQYGYAIFAKRPVSLIMDSNPLIVDYYTSINNVAETAMTREEDKTYDNILITKGSKFCGIVSIKKLLQFTTALEKNYARELNPLTSLPGNVIINRVLQDAVMYSNSGYILYIDLDNFKVYNDVYGFENGDKIIKETAHIIQTNVKELFPFTSFIGHIGGDDFVCLVECTKSDCIKLCEKIISEFDEKILDFFSEKDKKNKCIKSESRDGNLKIFDLTSISIAALSQTKGKFDSVDELAQKMSFLKKEVKKRRYSNYLIKDEVSLEQ